MRTLDSVTGAAASAGGQILRAATRLVAARPAAKPLHPQGAVVRGVLHRSGTADGVRPETGAAWLDAPGDDPVLVRHSRALGLPGPAPDIFGLAIRVPTAEGRHGDVLLATTGLGRLTRFTLTASRSPYRRPMTTLLPYRTPVGPVVLSAVFLDETTLRLAWAERTGAWHPFAELVLREEPDEGSDAFVSYDPVTNTLPGLTTYDWVRRLREPAYATARRTRRS